MSSLSFTSEIYLKNIAVKNSPPMVYRVCFSYNINGSQNRTASKLFGLSYRKGSLKKLCDEEADKFADNVGRHKNSYRMENMRFECVSVYNDGKIVPHDTLGRAIAKRLFSCCRSSLDSYGETYSDYCGTIGMHSDY